MDGPSFLILYVIALLALLFASWVVRLFTGDLFVIRLLFAMVFVSIGLVRYFDSTSAHMHNWTVMWVGMACGTILFFIRADQVSTGGSSGGGCGSGDGGGCGGGGCGGCG